MIRLRTELCHPPAGIGTQQQCRSCFLRVAAFVRTRPAPTAPEPPPPRQPGSLFLVGGSSSSRVLVRAGLGSPAHQEFPSDPRANLRNCGRKITAIRLTRMRRNGTTPPVEGAALPRRCAGLAVAKESEHQSHTCAGVRLDFPRPGTRPPWFFQSLENFSSSCPSLLKTEVGPASVSKTTAGCP
jgi:hypothetical protein